MDRDHTDLIAIKKSALKFNVRRINKIKIYAEVF